MAEHGDEVTIPGLDKLGHELVVSVERATRELTIGDEAIPYPMHMPLSGENVAWGAWSRKGAARGLVCWWLLDPGISSRGHRDILLTPDFNHCGVGCARSRRGTWVATFDATSVPLQAYVEKSPTAKRER